jgi:hypothetical protein
MTDQTTDQDLAEAEFHPVNLTGMIIVLGEHLKVAELEAADLMHAAPVLLVADEPMRRDALVLDIGDQFFGDVLEDVKLHFLGVMKLESDAEIEYEEVPMFPIRGERLALIAELMLTPRRRGRHRPRDRPAL